MRTIIFNILLFTTLMPGLVLSQNGSLQGLVFNPVNNEPIPFANVIIFGTNIGSVTDLDGRFVFYGLQPGYTKVQVSSIGYETKISADVLVTNAKTAYITVELREFTTSLEEVTVKASVFKRDLESPVSLRSIGISEIEKNPGGNRDISKIIQSLPGVAGSVSYRNDLVVRGGGPGENRFYLDGVEIPNLNHFSTQGASGGPVGIINVDFIREVDFYSGAFPANRGNALSSIIDFQQIDGNKDKTKYRATIGASDLALTLDGPVGEKSSIVFSARRSYLQFLFAALDLSFLPTYNDAQFKFKTRIDDKNELTFIGIGAVDQFRLNLDANETERQRYTLGYLPVYLQWNYTLGGVYKHYRENGYHTVVVSRNHLNNRAYKYANNIEADSLKLYDYKSDEIETKLRYENTIIAKGGMRINYGAGLEYAQYFNNTYQLRYSNGFNIVDYKTDLDLFKYSTFGQVSRGIFKQRLIVSLGIRLDANSYSDKMNNLLNQFSPRLSLSYPIAEKWSVNFNTGRFYQIPPYTALGFGSQTGVLVNKQNGIKYIQSDHLVGGIEYQPNQQSKITLEGFYKLYNNYPFSVSDSVAIASKGAGYGTFADEALLSIGKGRSYGIEFYMRNTNFFKFNTIVSYTFVRSEFEDIGGKYIPTAWDNRHLLTVTATRKFKGNWDAGFKYRYAGGSPYTPYDETKSGNVLAWNASRQGYLDYSRYNTQRLNGFGQLDLRVDKSFYYDKWSLMLYIDIQNVLLASYDSPPIITTDNDADGNPVVINSSLPVEQQQYQMRYLPNDNSGTAIPSVGIMIEF